MKSLVELFVTSIGIFIVAVGIAVLDSSLIPGLSAYRTPLAILIILLGGSIGIYGLGLNSDESKKDRLLDFLEALLQGAP
ncbi:MAG: hypothetical protein ABEJ87_01760 [Candidatus Nanohalobium sp.]